MNTLQIHCGSCDRKALCYTPNVCGKHAGNAWNRSKTALQLCHCFGKQTGSVTMNEKHNEEMSAEKSWRPSIGGRSMEGREQVLSKIQAVSASKEGSAADITSWPGSLPVCTFVTAVFFIRYSGSLYRTSIWFSTLDTSGVFVSVHIDLVCDFGINLFGSIPVCLVQSWYRRVSVESAIMQR